jgi:hypothetical protein
MFRWPIEPTLKASKTMNPKNAGHPVTQVTVIVPEADLAVPTPVENTTIFSDDPPVVLKLVTPYTFPPGSEMLNVGTTAASFMMPTNTVSPAVMLTVAVAEFMVVVAIGVATTDLTVGVPIATLAAAMAEVVAEAKHALQS